MEAHSTQREIFGFRRVRASVAAHSQGTLIAGLRSELADFTGPHWAQEDDVTLVVLERLPTAAVGENELMPEITGHQLLHLSVPSVPGGERSATAQIVAAVKAATPISPGLAERLQTAVAETLMNAIEHGNQFRPELMAEVEVALTPERLIVRVSDQGGSQPIPAVAEPDLEAKLAGLQSARGWGLFLIKSMVDEFSVQSDETQHVVQLVFNLAAGNSA